MEQNVKPVLTIGMIVKNEIRCLERCLKAFEPLRKALPCELIIADTGSDDGTRKIAGKYADLVFDFPWINDFAAARNSVLDKAHGEWFLTVDADEYLDEDCEELINYLKNPDAQWNNFCGVIIRNYGTTDLIGPYSDFMAIRMVRMSTGRGIAGLFTRCGTMTAIFRFMACGKRFFITTATWGSVRKRQRKSKNGTWIC